MPATSSSTTDPVTGQHGVNCQATAATAFCELMCIYCSSLCMDWRSLFDHVIDCPVRRATGSTPASRPVTSGSGSSGKSGGSVGSCEGHRLLPGSGQHRCVCGLSYSQSYNLQRHQRAKGCLESGKGVTVSQSAVSATKKETSAGSGSKSPFICPYAECGKEILFERNYHSHLQYHEQRLLKLSLPRSHSRAAHSPALVTGPGKGSVVTPDAVSAPSPLVQTYAAEAIDVQMEVELS